MAFLLQIVLCCVDDLLCLLTIVSSYMCVISLCVHQLPTSPIQEFFACFAHWSQQSQSAQPNGIPTSLSVCIMFRD